MSRKVTVKPGGLTVMGARIGALVAALFLVFGAVFGFVMLQDMPDSESGLRLLTIMFFVIWIVVCGAMILFYLRVATGKGNVQADTVAELQIDDAERDDGDSSPPSDR